METVGIFYAHLEYVMAFWYIVLSFGSFVVIWYILSHFGIGIVSRKIWQPCNFFVRKN
jgi:hypothetical protein